MSKGNSVLFTAAHGFYEFAVSQEMFDRSLFYNLLLQPSLAIPDHYFLHGSRVATHLDRHKSRDSWIETGLRNGFIEPFFREDGSSLVQLLDRMRKRDRRGFGASAENVAERLDRTRFAAKHWSSTQNSIRFGEIFRNYITSPKPPAFSRRVDPEDFIGFWDRSRAWIGAELTAAFDRSSELLGSEGLLLSQLMQVTGDRLLAERSGRIENVTSLIDRVERRLGPTAGRDLRVYYSIASEMYNRSLADTISASTSSPRWSYYVASMDLWRDGVRVDEVSSQRSHEADALGVGINLPQVAHLRRVSGDLLLSVRKSPSCERYFESLAHWTAAPHDSDLRAELVTSLARYTIEIRKQVGRDVGVLGLRPQFLTGATDVTRVIEKMSGLVQGFLAVGAGSVTAGTAVAASNGQLPAIVPVTFATLFLLQTVGRYISPSESVDIRMSSRDGVRIYPDVTVTRA